MSRHRYSNSEVVVLWQRLAWFVGLWLAGVAVVGAIAFVLRRVLIG